MWLTDILALWTRIRVAYVPRPGPPVWTVAAVDLGTRCPWSKMPSWSCSVQSTDSIYSTVAGPVAWTRKLGEWRPCSAAGGMVILLYPLFFDYSARSCRPACYDAWFVIVGLPSPTIPTPGSGLVFPSFRIVRTGYALIKFQPPEHAISRKAGNLEFFLACDS